MTETVRAWCKFCGAVQCFTRLQLDLSYVVPPCPRCGEQDWGNEIEELIAPDFRELSPTEPPS